MPWQDRDNTLHTLELRARFNTDHEETHLEFAGEILGFAAQTGPYLFGQALWEC